MDSALRYADVAEGVRAAIAAYTHAVDDGRTDDVVDTYCADGGCDIPGLGGSIIGPPSSSPEVGGRLRPARAATRQLRPHRLPVG